MPPLPYAAAAAVLISGSLIHAHEPVRHGALDTSDHAFEHLHFSPVGTPIVHSFGIEPAFTGRDLFIDYSWLKGSKATRHEVELEFEWAFTNKLGLILEIPYISEHKKGFAHNSGFGDISIVPRALLIESDHFMLTGQIEATLPTGSDSFGGEKAIAPGFSLWHDLGNWFTLNSQAAIEHTFDEDTTELAFGLGLVKSFGEKPEIHVCHDHDHHHAHSASNIFNLHFELLGSTPLNGEEKGHFSFHGLIGLSYGIRNATDIRLGYQFPIHSDLPYQHQLTAGISFHF